MKMQKNFLRPTGIKEDEIVEIAYVEERRGVFDELNLSFIFTRLVQAAGKICKWYASDIVIDIGIIERRINEDRSFEDYYCFYDSGVHGSSHLFGEHTDALESMNKFKEIYKFSYEKDGNHRKIVLQKMEWDLRAVSEELWNEKLKFTNNILEQERKRWLEEK